MQEAVLENRSPLPTHAGQNLLLFSIFYAFLWTLNLLKQLVTSVYLLLALISFNVFSSFFYHCPKVY
ncbi:uncharacterized protein OCT59_018631 [Rhizophagus irregularis]|uniref:uncharacterized protein n=1 Tax=Rhizophagus irregularis TaxID=588596 RepID=UPI00333085D1|nr:hypothetical protein OCT59_018631 [Rhizophagus irregularis]